jgi:hypothetical protein
MVPNLPSGAIEIQCVNCGSFGYDPEGKSVKRCPRCFSPQIITLSARWDIDQRFRDEQSAQRSGWLTDGRRAGEGPEHRDR